MLGFFGGVGYLEGVALAQVVGVEHAARRTQGQQVVDYRLELEDAPGAAPDLGGDHALGDGGFQLLDAR